LHGNLAETFFNNLRALTTTGNIAIILVGGENMPFIMERQGEKLNKFTRQNVSYFSRATEWDDFLQLVRRPTHNCLKWSDDAVSAIFNETNGNPYFTNLLCTRVLQEAIRSRDGDVTANEVSTALDKEVTSLDANSFAHLWHDGVLKPSAEREPVILRRRQVLTALARCARKDAPLTFQNIASQKSAPLLGAAEMAATLNDFVRRDVLSEMNGEFRFRLPIFERWLKQGGLAVIQPDAVSEELAARVQSEEGAAFVRSEELVTLVNKWPTYQGRHITTDDVRAWYQQVDGFRNQRLLFKLLSSIKFVSESELRDRSVHAFVQLNKQLQEFVRQKLTGRRVDVLLTYLDGHGKSGEQITSVFAEENKISVKQICSRSELPSRLNKAISDRTPVSAIIIVDDLAATGGTLSRSVVEVESEVADLLIRGNTKLLACVLYSTKAASERILESLRTIHAIESDFRVGEFLSPKLSAFSEQSAIWASEEERVRAKALVSELGARVYKTQPLGYGGMGLLLVFPATVPNNSLPILHSSSKSGQKPWRPLFPRPTN